MSSFAVATLVQKEHQNKIIPLMEEGSYLIELNGSWLAYLPKRDRLQELEGIAQHVFDGALLRMSMQAPLLYINHPEDHGWACAVLDQGAVSCCVGFTYGWEGLLTGPVGPTIAEMIAVAEQLFARFDAEAFRRLGAGEAAIDIIRSTMTVETFLQRDYGMMDPLIEALDCDISFVSWQYVDDSPEQYKIVAKA